ncbi:MAG: TIGR01777 family oxidoreductase [Chloroflexota bacterium]
MKIVISGATGFIGSHLVRALEARGDKVVALTRNVLRASRALGPGVDVMEWNPSKPGEWVEAVNGAGAVVNLAGETVVSPTKPWTAGEKTRIRASRVDTTRALVAAIAQASAKPPVFVNASAIGYYGSRGDVQLTESSPPGSDFLARLCVDWEAAAKEVEPAGVRLVLVRTGIVLGKDGGVLPMLALPFRFFAGGTMGNPGQWVSWIHIDDEVGLMLSAIDNREMKGPINLTAPNPVTMERFSRDIGRTLERPSWVPAIGLAMKLGLGERGSVLLASQRVLPEVAQQSGYTFRYIDSAVAIRSLLFPE